MCGTEESKGRVLKHPSVAIVTYEADDCLRRSYEGGRDAASRDARLA